MHGGFLVGLLIFMPSVGHAQAAPSGQPSDHSDPQSRLWLIIKQQLSGPRAEQTFEETIQDAVLPGGMNGLKVFEGRLVSSTPAEHPHEFLVTLLNETTPEVTLKLQGELEKPLPPGTWVTFEGVVKAFKAEPFMLIFEVATVNRATKPRPAGGTQRSK